MQPSSRVKASEYRYVSIPLSTLCTKNVQSDAITCRGCSLTDTIVALKEIRLQQEEGTPFTAIREGVLPGVLRSTSCESRLWFAG